MVKREECCIQVRDRVNKEDKRALLIRYIKTVDSAKLDDRLEHQGRIKIVG